MMEECLEMVRIACTSIIKIVNRFICKEQGKHRTHTLHHRWHIVFLSQFFKAITQCFCAIFHLFKDGWVSLQHGQCSKACRYSYRITTQSTGLVNRTGWCYFAHNFARAAKYSKRHTTANDFTEASQIGFNIV